ncbi:hypothetical protein KM043_016761 [Ampulex compressa]|nr:hypothetical protein KM043_016761 [Ampulex compressa]
MAEFRLRRGIAGRPPADGEERIESMMVFEDDRGSWVRGSRMQARAREISTEFPIRGDDNAVCRCQTLFPLSLIFSSAKAVDGPSRPQGRFRATSLLGWAIVEIVSLNGFTHDELSKVNIPHETGPRAVFSRVSKLPRSVSLTVARAHRRRPAGGGAARRLALASRRAGEGGSRGGGVAGSRNRSEPRARTRRGLRRAARPGRMPEVAGIIDEEEGGRRLTKTILT